MLLLIGGLLGLSAGLLTGGSVHNLLAHRVRWPLVVVAAFVLRIVDRRTALADTSLAPVLFVASLVVLVAWSVWHWDRLPGIWLVASGIAMNLAVVLANGGRMPVISTMLDRGPAVLAERGFWAEYTVAGPGTRLNWLGDYLAMPAPISMVFPQAYSPGDLVALVGMAVTLFMATRPVPGARPAEAITTP